MELTGAERAALDAARARDAALSPDARKRQGIVHTPPELARFIARAVDALLQRELGLASGLADPQLSVIDPACGPLAFFSAVHAVADARAQRPHVLLGLDREACGGHGALLGWPVRLQQLDTLASDPAALGGELSDTLAVIGNPPWIGSAQPAAAPWLERALEELRRDEHGARLLEKKLGVLSDAYVRFFAWSIALARQARGGAVLGLVTNASYLDGPVHRGLRAALRRSFDRVEVIDLGGGALVAREGRAEGNVFGVRTPAAVLLAVRKPEHVDGASPLASVRYARIHGDVASKLEQLARVQLDELAAPVLDCDAPGHRFVPGRGAPPEYLAWPSLDELMPFHREGVQTNRDEAVVDASAERLLQRLTAFAKCEAAAGLESVERALAHYDPERARRATREALQQREPSTWLRRIAYRPLDTRWFAALAPLCHRPRPDLLLAMDAATRAHGFALVTARKDRGEVPWRHIAAVADVVDNSFLSTRSSCRARAVPTHTPDGRENLDLAACAGLFARAERTLSALDVACYALARLSSPRFQATHEAWLRTDYPRVPLPHGARDFAATLAQGRALLAAWCGELGRSADASLADELVVGHQRVLERWIKGQAQAAVQQGLRATRARAGTLAALIAALDAG